MARTRTSLLEMETGTRKAASCLHRLDRQLEPKNNGKRAAGKRAYEPAAKGGLKSIAHALERRGPRTRTEAVSFDHGGPIELRYRSGPAARALAQAASAEWDADATGMLEESEPFSVEAFELGASGAGSGDHQRFYGTEPVTGEPGSPPAPPAPVETATGGAGGTTPARPPSPQAAAVKAARALSDEEFDLDLEAMRAEAPEESDWSPSEQALAVRGAPPPAAAVGPAPEGEPPAASEAADPEPKEHPHALFDRMASAARYANQFDLGAVDLSDRFDSFERELTREDATAEAMRYADALSESPELDELDVAADLMQIAEEVANSVKKPAAARPSAPGTAPAPAPSAPGVEPADAQQPSPAPPPPATEPPPPPALPEPGAAPPSGDDQAQQASPPQAAPGEDKTRDPKGPQETGHDQPSS